MSWPSQSNKLFISIDLSSEQVHLEWAKPSDIYIQSPTTDGNYFKFNISISRAINSSSFLSDCKTWIQFHERIAQELKYLKNIHKVQNVVKNSDLEKVVIEFHSSETESDQFPNFSAEMEVSTYPQSNSPLVFPSPLWQQRHPQLLNQWKQLWGAQKHPLALSSVVLLWLQLFAVRNDQ